MTVNLQYCNECGRFLEGSLWGENLEGLTAMRTEISGSHGLSIEQGQRVVCDPCFQAFPAPAKGAFEHYAVFEPILEASDEVAVSS